ncbi:MAG: hypothetical protein IT384_32250 [Deltaproteobacteria bacterium]|nr:hypothetical protein [Deltaproteobacteria bacterium]
MNRSWAGAVHLAVAGVCTLTGVCTLSALVACDEDFGKRCGPGTLEQNGECVPESPGGNSLSCGTGTVERDGACVPSMTLSCGAGTRESDAEYKAPAFDAVGLKRGAAQLEATLNFVPIVPGTFESYCQLGVMDGARFPDIIAGAVTPNYASGHAGAGMHAKLEITDPMGLFASHTLSQDQLIDRPAALDKDPRLASSWWSNPTVNQGRCCTDVVVDLAEPSDTEFVFEVGGERLDEAHPLVLAKDFGYKLSFRNTSATRKHYFSAPKFFETTIMRRAEDTHAYVVAPYLFEAAPLAGKQVDAYVVPTVAARFGTYCSIGVREGVHGAPDLATGHAGAGMRAPVLVTSTTTSTGT